MSVTKRKTVIIHRALIPGNVSFSYDFELDFAPETMIVRDISFGGIPLGDLHGVRVPWIDSKEGLIATFIEDSNFTSQPGSFFNVSEKSLQNGSLGFEVYRLQNDLTANIATGNLSMTLEFGQKVDKPYDPKPIDMIAMMREIMAVKMVYPFGLGKGEQAGGAFGMMEEPECSCGFSNVQRTLPKVDAETQQLSETKDKKKTDEELKKEAEAKKKEEEEV